MKTHDAGMGITAVDRCPDELPDGLTCLRRWLVSLFDGLVTTEARVEIDEQLLTFVRARPIMFAAFVSGVVSDLLISLPAEDPWRHTEESEGCIRSAAGNPFGCWEDGADLHHRADADLKSEPKLAALHAPLSTPAAEVIHLGSHGWRVPFEKLSNDILLGKPADELLLHGCTAVRWVVHRRRAYMGADDAYALAVGWSWGRRADNVDRGVPWDESRRARLARQEKVPDGLHEWFAAR
ncbi:hypothetical protein [Pseudarthrobacter sp. PH31-O2]|uniref:hypothetical protein n=1 Tax=Pseudarthrobacter sp. PH31-O2 TaxID=3046206 RepID=UPI0024B9CD45|nr:hypothetical protein [Pseudarthrobacter sp. PH31-O2]MDJ0354403.1 hypothetical protein [Pseudarthrobacter sp. PH31-O2]